MRDGWTVTSAKEQKRWDFYRAIKIHLCAHPIVKMHAIPLRAKESSI